MADEKQGDRTQESYGTPYQQDLLKEIIPFVESHYSVYTDRDHRAIAGLSLGGAQALALGLSHTELFSRVAAFSPAMGAANNPATGGVDFDNVLADAPQINSQIKFLWVSCGTEDTLFQSVQQFSTQLSQHKVEHIFRVTGGAHTYPVWQRNLNDVAPVLFAE
jgi:enterochelin esterase-like enzyme